MSLYADDDETVEVNGEQAVRSAYEAEARKQSRAAADTVKSIHAATEALLGVEARCTATTKATAPESCQTCPGTHADAVTTAATSSTPASQSGTRRGRWKPFAAFQKPSPVL